MEQKKVDEDVFKVIKEQKVSSHCRIQDTPLSNVVLKNFINYKNLMASET